MLGLIQIGGFPKVAYSSFKCFFPHPIVEIGVFITKVLGYKE